MLFLYLRINRITLRNIGRNTKHVNILIIFLNVWQNQNLS